METGKRILVVEDDDVACELMRRALERHGYEVRTAADGIEGYDAAHGEPPDLIITDVNMPSADGAHFVRRVRDTPELASTPILVTTGYGTGNATFVMSLGANAYEPKPLDLQSLLATVRRLLGTKHQGG
ncbi:MAG: response regulator [Pyrinomonadaceae bacterium MAG19_C2-C3]|nr:response regulator [Pyrinomonadaceae bacterium MAG19_C2-C3]